MKKQLVPGVDLLLFPSQQFKSVQVIVNFAQPAQSDTTSRRALLSYIQAVSSQAYPSQQALAQALIERGGLRYQSDVGFLGGLHQLRFTLQFTEPRFMGQPAQYLFEQFDFLKGMIFQPVFSNPKFASSILPVEKQSLKQELASIRDDKDRYLFTKLKAASFDQKAVAESALGKVAEVEKIQPEELEACHAKMLRQDQVTIAVLGNFDEKEVQSYFQTWPLEARKSFLSQAQIEPRQGAFESRSEQMAGMEQILLAQSYRFKGKVNPYHVNLLNGLLAGGPSSLMFRQLREEASLAYSVDSRWQQDRSWLYLTAGINRDALEESRAIIAAGIQALRDGDFSENTLAATKADLLNQMAQRVDLPGALLSGKLTQELSGNVATFAEQKAAINAVTAEEVAELAQAMRPVSEYILHP
ncbi:M16 family metallopeptidase [Eupransor demetentiae]|uniref:M16 family metallopeptidase n=1 Tax=Eupransor demetentiae TaxID=3109584 RepID=UPI0032E358B8